MTPMVQRLNTSCLDVEDVARMLCVIKWLHSVDITVVNIWLVYLSVGYAMHVGCLDRGYWTASVKLRRELREIIAEAVRLMSNDLWICTSVSPLIKGIVGPAWKAITPVAIATSKGHSLGRMEISQTVSEGRND
jgi:hypothetical protein